MRVTAGPTVTGSVDINDGVFEARFRKFKDGKGYVAGFQVLSPSAAGNKVSCRLVNPAASGKTVFVTGGWVASSVASRIDFERPVTPAAGSLGTAATVYGKKVGQAAAVATASFKNNTPGVSVADPSPSIQVPVSQTAFTALGYVLTADSSCDMDFEGTVTTDEDTFFWEWYEE